jgi:chromosome segregation ATPase
VTFVNEVNMPFNDAELDRLGEKRRSLKEEQRACRAKMEETYRDIEEIKSRIPSLREEIDPWRQGIEYFREERRKAERRRAHEDARSYSVSINSNYDQIRGIREEIHRLQEKRVELWDRHNQAKKERRQAADAYAEVDAKFQDRLAKLRNSMGRSTPSGRRKPTQRRQG